MRPLAAHQPGLASESWDAYALTGPKPELPGILVHTGIRPRPGDERLEAMMARICASVLATLLGVSQVVSSRATERRRFGPSRPLLPRLGTLCSTRVSRDPLREEERRPHRLPGGRRGRPRPSAGLLLVQPPGGALGDTGL